MALLTKPELIDFELRVQQAWERGEIKAPVHLSGGNEDQLIDIFKEIRDGDYVFSGHRNHSHALLHGVKPDDLFREICGESGGSCNARARSMGFIDASHNFYSSAIVGGCCAIAVGVAWALKQERLNNPLNTDEVSPPPRHVWVFIGDGAVDGGHFWEALQYAECQELPITFVIENNNRATCTTIDQRLGDGLRQCSFRGHPRVQQYFYTPSYPHVGSGTYVQF